MHLPYHSGGKGDWIQDQKNSKVLEKNNGKYLTRRKKLHSTKIFSISSIWWGKYLQNHSFYFFFFFLHIRQECRLCFWNIKAKSCYFILTISSFELDKGLLLYRCKGWSLPLRSISLFTPWLYLEHGKYWELLELREMEITIFFN